MSEIEPQNQKLKATSLSEAVYEALRESIVSLNDPPGALLTENAIAARYGVARPTAKAALERLVTEGLLRRRAHRAAQVPVLSRADIEDLYAARLLIEEASIVSLAKTGVVPLAALKAHREIKEFSENGENAPFARPDLTFHHALVAGNGSPRLSRMHELIMGEIQLCMGQLQSHQLLRAKEIAAQHQGLIDAIESRDSELAGFLIRRHINNARDRLLTRFAEKGRGSGT
ncbi:GntR family transcriptional regulator [Devosia nitrariae]|nr:GntR family transcriptional regulator [Devosia nitrariae]